MSLRAVFASRSRASGCSTSCSSTRAPWRALAASSPRVRRARRRPAGRRRRAGPTRPSSGTALFARRGRPGRRAGRCARSRSLATRRSSGSPATEMPDLVIEVETTRRARVTVVPHARDARGYRTQRQWGEIWSLAGVTAPVDAARLRAYLATVRRREPARSLLRDARRARASTAPSLGGPGGRGAPPARSAPCGVLAARPEPRPSRGDAEDAARAVAARARASPSTRGEREVRVRLHPAERVADRLVVAVGRALRASSSHWRRMRRMVRRRRGRGARARRRSSDGSAQSRNVKPNVAVRRLVAHDAPEHGARQRVPRRVPRALEERDGQRLADAEEADDHVRGAQERAAATSSASTTSVVGIVLDLGAAAELHRHAGAELDVHELVDREARRQRDEIDGRAALEERAQRRARTRCPCGAPGTRPPSTPCARRRARRAEICARVERSPGHRLDLGPHLAVAALDALAEQLELEELGARAHRSCQRGAIAYFRVRRSAGRRGSRRDSRRWSPDRSPRRRARPAHRRPGCTPPRAASAGGAKASIGGATRLATGNSSAASKGGATRLATGNSSACRVGRRRGVPGQSS